MGRGREVEREVEKEKQPETDGDGRRDDGRWECFYYRFMWRDDWRGSRGTHREEAVSLFLFFFFKEGMYTLFSLLSGARAGGPSPGARRLRRRRRAGTIFSDSIRTAQVFFAFFDSFSFFLIFFFFL